ncbi:MAG: phosphoribosylformylglycinamidine synthase I [Chloroflexi bacterium RBG_13_52_12]|nr:MAG: phosphoribosylformylglycinamidine synthase I [Chloroflexi bacterium RBG_13_52_12]
MSKVKVLMLRAPGTNRDGDTQIAFETVGAEVGSALVTELLRKEKRFSDYHIMVIPGGFTYGDDISAGRIMANEIRLRLGEDIKKFVEDGRLVLGICNGFQVLVKTGILPGIPGQDAQPVTLTNNDSGKFECRWVYLKVNKKSPCVFTKGIKGMYIPIAHGEGKLAAAPDVLEKLNIVVQYVDEKGNTKAGYPSNPNGSAKDIAGICDPSGRIFGMMPHPEDFIRWTQHPRWTREKPREDLYGLQIFANAVAWAKGI